MPPGLVVLGVLAFVRLPFLNTLAQQHAQPEFAQARYVHRANGRLVVLILLMFGIFFVDSLGFLHLLETPRFMERAN